jgi:hypothetical protein
MPVVCISDWISLDATELQELFATNLRLVLTWLDQTTLDQLVTKSHDLNHGPQLEYHILF